jgi:hypothetical protein
MGCFRGGKEMNEIMGNVQPMAVVNPPMRKVVDLTQSKRERADLVAKELGDWLGEQGFNIESHGRVIDSNGPPTEIQNRISSWFGHSEHHPTFSEDKVLTDYDETFDKQYNPPRGLADPHMVEAAKDINPKWSENTQKELDELKANQDDYDTSDLQGIVMALAMKEVRITPAETLDSADARRVAWEMSDDMLEYIYEGHNPGFRFPKAKTAVEQAIAGEVAVKLSRTDPSVFMPRPSGNPNNEQELSVCCEAKPETECGCETKENPHEYPDSRVKCDICGEWVDNTDEIIYHFKEKHPDDPRLKNPAGEPYCPTACGWASDEEPPKPNRHYTKEERERIMRTPEFRSWIRAWKSEKKKRPKQGYFHAFMSDVGHKAFAHSPKKWPSAVRYSDKDSVEVPKKRKHYIQVGQKKRTIRGVKRMKPISNPEGRMVYEGNPPSDEKFNGWYCYKCGDNAYSTDSMWGMDKVKEDAMNHVKTVHAEALMVDFMDSWIDLEEGVDDEIENPPKKSDMHDQAVEILKKKTKIIPIGDGNEEICNEAFMLMEDGLYSLTAKQLAGVLERLGALKNPKDIENPPKCPNPDSWKSTIMVSKTDARWNDDTVLVLTAPSKESANEFMKRWKELKSLDVSSPIDFTVTTHQDVYDIWFYIGIQKEERENIVKIFFDYLKDFINAPIETENPKSKSWLMERRKKFRYPTGAGSREKFWVRGHKRGIGMFADGTPVKGHYRAANPDDEKESIGSLALDNPPKKTITVTKIVDSSGNEIDPVDVVKFDYPNKPKFYASNQNYEEFEITIKNKNSLALDNPPKKTITVTKIVDSSGNEIDPVDVVKFDYPNKPKFYASNQNYEEFEITIKTGKSNPPEHEHTFKFLGMCNPIKGGKSQKLFKCEECGKTFVENK